MGYQTTKYITRENAIDRILRINELINNKHYLELEQASYEDRSDVEEFIEEQLASTNTLITSNELSHWTNRMLARQVSEPYYRYSMMEEYSLNARPED